MMIHKDNNDNDDHHHHDSWAWPWFLMMMMMMMMMMKAYRCQIPHGFGCWGVQLTGWPTGVPYRQKDQTPAYQNVPMTNQSEIYILCI